MKAFQAFFKTESASGILLLAATAAALAWANSPWGEAYFRLLASPIHLALGPVPLPHSPLHWINDGCMALFFLLVGLEIKRELLAGELSRPAQALLPMAAALGGMLVPALIYSACNRGGPGSAGWGIPMATDIAFALGVLSLLGKRVPPGLKVFLAALAILDDLGAVLIIALFYSARIDGPSLAAAAAVVAVLMALGRLGVKSLVPYLVLGALLWLAVLRSGVHATVAGVLLAFCIPFEARPADRPDTPLLRLEKALHPWVSYCILPLFALANAGVALDASALASLAGPVGLGVSLGLVIGKPLGILAFSALAVRLRLGELPDGVAWRHMAGCGLLGGIGFTMSIFIASLGLGGNDLLAQAKLAILAGSLASGLLGGAWLLRAMRAPAYRKAG